MLKPLRPLGHDFNPDNEEDVNWLWERAKLAEETMQTQKTLAVYQATRLAKSIETLEVTNWCEECYSSIQEVGITSHHTHQVTLIRLEGDWSELKLPQKQGES